MNQLRNTIYYEWYTVDELDAAAAENRKARPARSGYRLIGTTNITTGIDTIPSMSLTIPLADFPDDELAKSIEQNNGDNMYFEPRMARYVIFVYVQTSSNNSRTLAPKYIFRGIIDNMTIDYTNYAVQLSLSHQVARMREWAMPVNYAIKDMRVDFAASESGAALGYPNPPVGNGNVFPMQSYGGGARLVDFVFEGDMPNVEFTFSANNKLEALSELMKHTEFCHFFVDITKERPTIVVKNYDTPLDQTAMPGEIIISPYPVQQGDCDYQPSENNITLLTEPQFAVDYTNHYNRLVVFCGDVQDGVNHLTLEHIYNDPALQDPDFPVKMYQYNLNQQPEPEYDEGRKINNDKVYKNFDIIAYTSNTNREFFVQDTKQLEDDNNIVLNTTVNFDTLYPIPNLKQDIDNDGTVEELIISDSDRVAIELQAYYCAIRRLKSQRPQRIYQFNATALPVGTYDGQAVRLAYSKSVTEVSDECENDITRRKILNINHKFYLTKRTITFDDSMNEITTVTLDGEIRSRAISSTEIELIEEAATGGETSESVPDWGNYTNKEQPWDATLSQILGVIPKAPNTGTITSD